MVERYVKVGTGFGVVVVPQDLVWMASFCGKKGFEVAHGNSEEDELTFDNGGLYGSLGYAEFVLKIYRIPEKQSEQMMISPGNQVCLIDVYSDSFEQFLAVDPWFYDNGWPVYLDGEPAPYYDSWMNNIEEFFEDNPHVRETMVSGSTGRPESYKPHPRSEVI